MKRKPKFRIGRRITFKGDRRLRRTITGRYWDASAREWRYKMVMPGLRRDLVDAWAVVESELLPAKSGHSKGERE